MPVRHASAVVLLAAATFAQEPVPDAILHAEFVPTQAEVFGHVRFLADPALRGRDAGSPEGRIAGVYVAAEFAKLGLEPAGVEGTWFQPFERMRLVPGANAGEMTVVKATCRNVLAWLPGSDPALADEYLLLGAHYDHLGMLGDDVMAGADDNASGVAGMLGVARALVEGSHAPRRSILFVAFDAEERQLAGAEHFARHPPRSLRQMIAMINLDMIGRPRLLDRKEMTLPKRMVGIPDAPAMGVLGARQSPELAVVARAVFAAAELPLFAPEDFGMLGSVIEQQAAGRSDHAPFERREIPFLFFSTSENDDYHRPSDTLDKVDAEALWRATRCVYRTVLGIDALDERPTFAGGEAEAVPEPAAGRKDG